MTLDFKYYLNVPYKDKEEAKTFGCIWDPIRKQWYVHESNENLKNTIKWLSFD